MAITIVPSILRKQVEEGKKLNDLTEYYGLSTLQMKKALKDLGLKIRKFRKPSYIFVEEVEEQEPNTDTTVIDNNVLENIW